MLRLESFFPFWSSIVIKSIFPHHLNHFIFSDHPHPHPQLPHFRLKEKKEEEKILFFIIINSRKVKKFLSRFVVHHQFQILKKKKHKEFIFFLHSTQRLKSVQLSSSQVKKVKEKKKLYNKDEGEKRISKQN